MNPRTTPVIIGGSGGSGTRVVAEIVAAARHFLGANLNRSLDALDFVPLYDTWNDRFIRSGYRLDEPDMVCDFEACVARHRRPMSDPEGKWGWKNPRAMYLLPFLARRYPRLRFVHVVRDGRDMAFSGNQNQLRLHGRAVLGKPCLPLVHDRAVQSVELWAAANLRTARFGEEQLGDRYLRLRFEDVCAAPADAARTLLDFVGEPDADVSEVVARVRPPGTLGRWRDAPAARGRRLTRIASPALARFGYGLIG